MHSFRRTQTALSAYWILHGGPWLAYETPAVGYPWAIPFEFPVLQLVVALFAKIGIPLDVAGHIVSFCFFLGCLVPLRMIFREGGLGTRTYLASSILFLTSPLYLYWSRAFLIESCALFFSLSWLALLMHFLRAGRLVTAILATLCGCLAILAKATTFPAFAVVGGLLILAAAHSAWLEGMIRRRIIILVGSLGRGAGYLTGCKLAGEWPLFDAGEEVLPINHRSASPKEDVVIVGSWVAGFEWTERVTTRPASGKTR
jgi:hypothetical protein